MGDKGKPCGMPFVMSKELEMCEPTLSEAVLSIRNNQIHSQVYPRKPLIQKIWATHSGFMLLKNLDMSNRSRVAVWPVA